ncbi:MAG: protease modulator HflC [Acutalibacteraceae bacterium]
MKKAIKILLVIAALLVVVAALTCFYVVEEDEHACVVRFSKIIDVKSEAGIYMKLPFVDEIKVYPKNAQIYDITPADVILQDKKTMNIDSYVVWRIEDPLLFFQTIKTIEEAEARLDVLTYNNTQVKLGKLNQEDMVNEDPPEERNAMYREIAEKVGEGAAAYGIEVIDVKIKRIDLPSENEQAVYTRMISERKQIAEKYKADGELAAAEIINAADKEYNTIIADAQLAAEQKIAEGEREYMNLLAQAYDTQEKRFYTFIRALEALEASLTGSEKTLIIGRDSPLAEILLGN